MNYTVKQGDSLSIIARDVLNDIQLWQEIVALNNISNPNLIYPGQILILPKTVNNKSEASIVWWLVGIVLFILIILVLKKI